MNDSSGTRSRSSTRSIRHIKSRAASVHQEQLNEPLTLELRSKVQISSQFHRETGDNGEYRNAPLHPILKNPNPVPITKPMEIKTPNVIQAEWFPSNDSDGPTFSDMIRQGTGSLSPSK